MGRWSFDREGSKQMNFTGALNAVCNTTKINFFQKGHTITTEIRWPSNNTDGQHLTRHKTYLPGQRRLGAPQPIVAYPDWDANVVDMVDGIINVVIRWHRVVRGGGVDLTPLLPVSNILCL